MDTPRIQFGTKAFLGVIFLVALAMGAERQAIEALDRESGSVVRLTIAICLLCGCSFGIAGFVVGWPVRGFFFGLIVVPITLAALWGIAVSLSGY